MNPLNHLFIQVKQSVLEKCLFFKNTDFVGSSNSEKSGQSTDKPTFTASRPQTPPIGQRSSNKTRVTSGSRRPDRPITHLVPKHSPLHASPNYPSPAHYKSPKRDLHVNTE